MYAGTLKKNHRLALGQHDPSYYEIQAKAGEIEPRLRKAPLSNAKHLTESATDAPAPEYMSRRIIKRLYDHYAWEI